MTHVYLGFAPLSALSTSWCVLRIAANGETSELLSGVARGVDKALAATCEQLSGAPDAIGIAAPLYWTDRDDREADRILRGMVLSLGAKSATVPALPTVSGATITGGIMLAAQARQRWSETPITEAAPDALLIMDSNAGNFINARSVNSEAEKQAALAAYSARACCDQRQNWHDLRQFDKEFFDPVSPAQAAFRFPIRKR